MKYTCIRKCQYRGDDNKIRLAGRGQVVSLKEKPLKEHFQPIDGIEIDFLTMSEEELTEAKWSFDDAAMAISEEFGVDLKKGDPIVKADIVSQIIDARYRQVD